MGTPVTVTGTIENVFQDTHISLISATGTETFPIAQNAVLMVDNTQRTASFLRSGMPCTVLVDSNRQIISLVARSQTQSSVLPDTQNTQPDTQLEKGIPSLINDEGFVTAVSATVKTIAIRTQRVSITGQIINNERTFSLASNAVITHNGENATLGDIQVGDIAFFGYNGTTIYNIDLLERERTIIGLLSDVRPPDNQGTAPILIIEETDGRWYEFRVLPVTEINRGEKLNKDDEIFYETVNWNDLRLGDAIAAEVELDRLLRVNAVGEKTTVNGRLNEIRITERNTEITVTRQDGITLNYLIRPGIFDVYTLRIGTQLRINLDSREVLNIQAQSSGGQSQLAVIGFIQAIRTDGTITVVEEQGGAAARTYTIAVTTNTPVTRGGETISINDLRVNMNVYIIQTAEGSNIARSVTVLP
jgi:hypothetical protein